MRPDRSVDVDVAHAILMETYIHNPFALLYIDQNIVEIIQDTVSAMADAEVEYRQHMDEMADLY
jgi:hypothetical protein